MPGSARKLTVLRGEAGIYHCWARCVRRAWLLGQDPYTGKDYTHRRDWVIDRLQLLVASFAIDVAFFSVMSNHLHVVLRTNPRLVKRWGDQEVARRWLRVYPGKRVLDGNWIEPTQQQVEALARDKAKIKKLRKRMGNISWFMGALSEYIARRANFEDKVSGRFFEGRFGCRAVDGAGPLLVCGVYVDFNQLRAGEAIRPEECGYSSIALRLAAGPEGVSWLAPLTFSPDDLGDLPSDTGLRASDKGLLDISLDAYDRLLGSMAQRTVEEVEPRRQQPPPLPAEQSAILERFQIEPAQWDDTVEHYSEYFRRCVGNAAALAQRAAAVGRNWYHGLRRAAEVFR